MKITIIQGDITKVKADTIVNAVNSQLVRGGGVDYAIHEAAGPELQNELNEIKKTRFPNGLPIGGAIFTKPYNIPVKIIIHTVGPRYYSNDIGLLKNSYVNSLKIAEENNCKSVAFPAIATGAYGIPIDKSAEIVKDVLEDYKSKIIDEVILVLRSYEDFKVYNNSFNV